MKIKKITSQHRRDFRAVLVCEHCGHEQAHSGYDDDNYHENVIPKIPCNECGKMAPESYRPRGTRHPEGLQL
jgi:transcription elongation factor Elf1